MFDPSDEGHYSWLGGVLDDLGLESLDQLPVMDNPAQQAGMLDMLGAGQDSLPMETPLPDEVQSETPAAPDELFVLSGNQP